MFRSKFSTRDLMVTRKHLIGTANCCIKVKSKKLIPETEYHILASNADQLKSGAHMTTVLPTPKPFTSVETFERSNLFPPFFLKKI